MRIIGLLYIVWYNGLWVVKGSQVSLVWIYIDCLPFSIKKTLGIMAKNHLNYIHAAKKRDCPAGT